MSDPAEGLSCPECSAPFDRLVLYLAEDGPFYGCGECDWIEPHGPDVWTAEKVKALLEDRKEVR